MAFNSLLSLLVVTTLAALLADASELRIIGANQPGGFDQWEQGPQLTGNMVLCPDDLPAPFTIACIPTQAELASVRNARFFVDGDRVKIERRAPYVLTGDNLDRALPYMYPSMATFRCRFNTGSSAEATVTFSCDTPTPTPTVPEMTPTPTPVSMMATPMPTPEPVMATPMPMMQPAMTPEPRDPQFISSSCIRLGATSYESLRGNWDVRTNEIEYRPGDESTGIDQPSAAPVTYKFIPQVTSIYGIAVDMTTRHRVDHNDVWLRLPNVDFTLYRGNETVSDNRATNWIKGFHNNNRKAVRTLSIDFNGHVIASREPLMAGEEYEIQVGGRSTMVIVHNVILYPCDGTEAQCADTTFRRRAQNRCSRM